MYFKMITVKNQQQSEGLRGPNWRECQFSFHYPFCFVLFFCPLNLFFIPRFATIVTSFLPHAVFVEGPYACHFPTDFESIFLS